MTIEGIAPLDSVRTLKWKKITIEHLRNELPDVLEGAELVDLSVTLTSQNPPYVVRRHLFRRLQSTQELTFDTAVSVRSARDDLDVNNFVDRSFESDEQKDAYLEDLINSDDGFANAAELSMTQGPSASQIQAPASVDKGGVDTAGIPFIVGIAVAGVAVVVAIIALLGYSRRRRRRRQRFSGTGTAKATNATSARNSHPSAPPPYAADYVDPDEDSLYDLNLEVPMHSSRDESSVFTSNSSITMPFDDQVAFQKQSMYASAEDGVGAVSESFMANPSDQFYRYTVEAPPGMLGMVLETSALDGTPSVYGIKNTSPLASDVQVGDRLVDIDGLDVSEMDATAVSRLIAGKKKNQYRRLVFLRALDEDDQIQDVDDPD